MIMTYGQGAGSGVDSDLSQYSIDEVLATLQPIRDLAKNWDIDIASCLEDYLNELGHEFPKQDNDVSGSKPDSLNFAKAAILLQNSSNVYSRKVEYLYSLVYRALDELALNQQQQDKSRRGKAAASNIDERDLEEFFNFDPQQQFLLLDDVLPSAAPTENGDYQKINMVDSDHSRRRRSSFTPRRRISSSRYSVGATPTQLSVDRSVSAISASANRALMGSLDTTSLRLVEGRWDIREDGLYALPGRVQRNSNETASTVHTMSPGATHSPTHQSEAITGGNMSLNDIENNYGDDDGDDGGGFMFGEDNNDEATTPQQTRKSVKFAPMAMPRSMSSPKRKKDPWMLLDPHTLDTQKPKPLKIGRTIRLPNGVTMPPSECVTGSRTKRITKKEPTPEPPKPCVQSYIVQTFRAALAASSDSDADANNKVPFPRIPLHGLAFGDEFAYMAKAFAKQKAAERREMRKAANANPTGKAVFVPEFEEDDDDEENDGGGFAFGFGDNDDVDDDQNHNDDEQVQSGLVVGNTGLLSVDDAYKNVTDKGDGDHGSDDQSTTFEELCRAHIAAFAKGAEKYAAETKLSKRVHEWQERLVPILKEEEARQAFDIHQYGENVVDQMANAIQKRCQSNDLDEKENKTNRVSFRDITGSSRNYDVCRLFLACLSLANSGNIEFVDSTRDGKLLDLELRSADIERPMETYLAPSVAESASAHS